MNNPTMRWLAFVAPPVGLVRLGALVGVLAWAGCSWPEAKPDPTRLFLLPTATATGAGPAAGAGAARPSLGIRPVVVAAYLRGPALIAIAGGSEVRALAENRWAEPLADGVARVVHEALQGAAVTRSVVVFPASHAPVPELELSLRVESCEGCLPAEGPATARFVVEWSIQSSGADARVLVARRYAPTPLPWDGRDPAALAQALGQAATGLAQEIAAALQR